METAFHTPAPAVLTGELHQDCRHSCVSFASVATAVHIPLTLPVTTRFPMAAVYEPADDFFLT